MILMMTNGLLMAFLINKYEKCIKLFSDVESRFATVARDKNTIGSKSASNFEFEPSHSSIFTLGITSTLSNKTVVSRKIELKRKRTELQGNHELMEAHIKAHEQAQIEEAEVMARLKRDEAALEAEEQLLSQFERGSCTASSSGLQFSGLRQCKSQRSSNGKRSNAKVEPKLRKMSVNDSVTEPIKVFNWLKNLYRFLIFKVTLSWCQVLKMHFKANLLMRERVTSNAYF